MEKEFKNVQSQIKILESKKLIIKDYNQARKILENNNYYYIINGYKDLFLNKNSLKEEFKENVKLEEIYSLYEFDRKIRIIFLEYILLIERRIDTYIAYEFSKQYGHKNYFIQENFYRTDKNQDLITKFIQNVNREISHQYKNNNKMIIHYIDKYAYVPLWVLIRILPFGKVSKFYSFMKQREQNNISKRFRVHSNELKVYLTNLAEIRNICAHDEKLYDVRLRFKITNNRYHEILGIPQYKNNYICGVQDLFSVVLILKFLLEPEKFKSFYIEIIKQIEILKRRIQSIEFVDVLKHMGFPRNYVRLLNLN